MAGISRTHVLLGLMLVTVVVGGCKKKITVYQYPPYYNPQEVQKIGVFPFANRGGTVISDSLAATLAASGTYKHVYNSTHLKALAESHDMRDLFSDNPSNAAQSLKKFADVDAIVVGSVTMYGATTRTDRRDQTTPMVVGNQVTYYRQAYNVTRNEANVVAVASLIRTSDGTVLHSTAVPARGNAWAQGSPPKWDQITCLTKATNSAVYRLKQHFAVIPQQIEIEQDKAIRTASELYDGKWSWKDTFKVSDQRMFIVVTLPWQADRNRFRIVVVPKDQRTETAVKQITWDKKYGGGYGYLFNPSQIASAGGGPGVYTIKFYSGQVPVVTKDFRLVN